MAVGTSPRATVPPAVLAVGSAASRRSPAVNWEQARFLLFGRAIPAALFGIMGWIQVSKVATAVGHMPAGAGASTVASRVVAPALYAAFCSIPAILYLTRPRPKARDGRLVARSAAFTGTLMQLLTGTFLGTGPLLYAPPPYGPEMSVVISVIAFSGALWGLAYLRRSLSIIPEARRLATGGPYRLVRHPLYFFEILAAAALVVTGPHLVTAVSFVAFVGMQMVRARFEERLLAQTFPEYADYARRTSRLVPFVW